MEKEVMSGCEMVGQRSRSICHLQRNQQVAEDDEGLQPTERLQTSTERLQTSTERLQTSTERLQTSTERLQTSTEHVQMSTEHLQTSTEHVQTVQIHGLSVERYRDVYNSVLQPSVLATLSSLKHAEYVSQVLELKQRLWTALSRPQLQETLMEDGRVEVKEILDLT